MAGAVQSSCEEFARRGEVVVMAGAGVSAGPPACVHVSMPSASKYRAARSSHQECVDALIVPPHLTRFSVLDSFFFEAVDDAQTSLAKAVGSALESGLHARHQRLTAIFEAARAG